METIDKKKKDLISREDIELVVNDFYSMLIKKANVGKFFTDGISSWEQHIEHMLDYWESRILLSKTYEKSVLPIHIDIDKRFGNTFEPKHFEEWLKYWHHCIDERFEGENASLTKDVGSKMAENIYKKMFLGRKTPSWDELTQK